MSKSNTMSSEEIRDWVYLWHKPRGSHRALYDSVLRRQGPPWIKDGSAPPAPKKWRRDEVLEWCRERAPKGLKPWVGVDWRSVSQGICEALEALRAAMDDPEMPEVNERHGKEAEAKLVQVLEMMDGGQEAGGSEQ